jgi:hypothetical protein
VTTAVFLALVYYFYVTSELRAVAAGYFEPIMAWAEGLLIG